jgi:hypothetical protein
VRTVSVVEIPSISIIFGLDENQTIRTESEMAIAQSPNKMGPGTHREFARQRGSPIDKQKVIARADKFHDGKLWRQAAQRTSSRGELELGTGVGEGTSGNANSSDARLNPGSPWPNSGDVSGGCGFPRTPHDQRTPITKMATAAIKAFSIFMSSLLQKGIDRLLPLTQVYI